MELSAKEKKLYDIQSRHLQREKIWIKNEKEIIRLRKDREYKDLKLGDKLNLLNLKERKENECSRVEISQLKKHAVEARSHVI